MKSRALSILATSVLLSAPAHAADTPKPLHLSIDGIENGKRIPDQFAYCIPDGTGKTRNGGNMNPAISWSGAPEGVKSYAIIVVDKDVPASFELANQPGKTIPRDFARQDFYHWVLVDIPPSVTKIAQGQDSSGVTEGGKPTGKTLYGINGKNDYSKMNNGPNGGYDGPCPPWNDERLHHYHFTVYALDIPSLNLTSDVITGKEAEQAMAGHILARGEIVGTYSNNPSAQAQE